MSEVSLASVFPLVNWLPKHVVTTNSHDDPQCWLLLDQDSERKKREEREKKKAEVRARLEASSVKANKKKGFMTPERKKKLRVSKLIISQFQSVAIMNLA